MRRGDLRQRGLGHGGAEVALRHLRRAVREPPPGEERAAVAADAALVAARLGAPDARELLDEAIRLADDDPVARARLVLQRARVGALGGRRPGDTATARDGRRRAPAA